MNNTFLTNYSDINCLTHIKESFHKCRSFSLSVSFIKKAGLVLLEKDIEDALKRGVEGRIITSTYQNFTDIPSLELFLDWMHKYPNFKCHLDYHCFGDNGFHSKGYIFEFEDSYEFIVGSTNITRFALLKNIEWNVSLIDKEKFDSFNAAYNELNNLWDKTLLLDETLIKKYRILIDYAIEKWDMDYIDVESNKIKPNIMQRRALKEIRRYRDLGKKRALIIAATGSGKTYLSAFDANNVDAKRLLFIVHRDTILNDAMHTFEKVFGSRRSYGLYTGDKQQLDADFVFATNVMVAKHLDEFLDDEFDYIVIDECHHSVASSYKSIIEYFKPEFLLGLTATPERMDNEDVFEMFDTNVPFELRLKDAIVNDLVVPFHYYGIRDHLVDYSSNEKSYIAKEISKIDNIDFIVQEIEKHRPNGKLKCIAFCTSIPHAKTMAEAFNESGYCARALLGENDLGERIKSFNDLQDDNHELQIICAVDILNEGVDIPSINMVLFLRPTESSTIFLQQLGRGLRKYENKEYLTVLDFIGNNYDRSVQIAFALGTLGNNAGIEKAYLRELVSTNFSSLSIPGVVIDIDSLSKEEVLKYLDKTNFCSRRFLEKDYENFKQYLKMRHYPSHMDYLNSDLAPDLLKFMKAKINNKKNMSYYSFLKKIGESDLPLFNNEEEQLINNISDLLPLTRVDEYIIIEHLLEGELSLDELENYNSRVNKETLMNALHYLIKDNI
ncbi:MAG: DEAD/DEAH box helicase family protein, partial [Bacilli bacterium]|nr:DEAD/DEAH box helicase family protein [Bacilli bacterium]